MSLLIRNLNKSTNNTISRAKPCILQILPPHFSQQSQSLQVVQQQQVRWGRTVRIILQSDLPSGKGYAGDVMEVKAGYARNHLIPQKIAYYATPENFERFNITDPLLLKKDGLSKEEEEEGGKEDKVEVSEDQKEADRLRKYLKNKTVSNLFTTYTYDFLRWSFVSIGSHNFNFIILIFNLKKHMTAQNMAQHRRIHRKMPPRNGQCQSIT